MVRRRRKKPAKQSPRLLDQCEALERDFPEKFHNLVIERTKTQQKLFGQIKYDDPMVDKLHERLEKRYEDAEERKESLPPMLHIRVQYRSVVSQTRYERSLFSNIAHKADDLLDEVTADNDDSDYETLDEVYGIAGGLLSGLGLDNGPKPELRIVAVRALHVDKILPAGTKNGHVVVSCRYQKKNFTQKSRKHIPDYRHSIGFCHVFSFRGLPITGYWDAEFKIRLKLFTKDSSYSAYAVLSPNGCELGEVEDNLKCKATTDINLWDKYIQEGSEEIKEFFLPLIIEKADGLKLSNLMTMTKEIAKPKKKEEKPERAEESVKQKPAPTVRPHRKGTKVEWLTGVPDKITQRTRDIAEQTPSTRPKAKKATGQKKESDEEQLILKRN